MIPSPESLSILLPLFSIIFLFLGIFRNIYGVLAYFIILNAKLGDMYPALGAIRFELIAAIVVIIAIGISGKGLVNIFPSRIWLNKPFWVYVLISLLSMVQAINISCSWNFGGYPLIKLVAFYIMVVASIQNQRDLRLMIIGFILMTLWIGYEPFYNYILGNAPKFGYGDVALGSLGAASGHVALANTMSQVIPLSALFALSYKSAIRKNTLLIITLILVFVVIATKSRGGFIGLIFIMLGFTYLYRSNLKGMVLIGIVVAVIFSFAGAAYWSHMDTIKHGVHGSRSSSDRYLGLVNGISMCIKRPILGVGIGCYAEARKIYFHYYFYSHNLYGELLGELGLASFVWFFWIYAIWRQCKRLKEELDEEDENYKFYKNVLTGIQFCLLLRLFLGNFTHGWYIWFWFLMAAMCVAIESILKKEKNATKA